MEDIGQTQAHSNAVFTIDDEAVYYNKDQIEHDEDPSHKEMTVVVVKKRSSFEFEQEKQKEVGGETNVQVDEETTKTRTFNPGDWIISFRKKILEIARKVWIF